MWLLFMLLKFLILRKILNITFRKYCNVSEVIGCLYTLCSNHNFMEDLFVKYNKMYQKLYVSKVYYLFCWFLSWCRLLFIGCNFLVLMLMYKVTQSSSVCLIVFRIGFIYFIENIISFFFSQESCLKVSLNLLVFFVFFRGRVGEGGGWVGANIKISILFDFC